MKKLGYVIAALGAIAIAAPSIATAEEMVIRHGGDREHHHFGARAEFREHREHRGFREHREFREHRDHDRGRHRHHGD